jgi:hypothetical protein
MSSAVFPHSDKRPDFSGRNASGKEFQDKIFDDLRDWGFFVALNGTEHTHPDFVKLLHSSTDKTSLMIRYAPDGAICIGSIKRSAYVEAKNSRYIERDAYENYMRLSNDGAIVYVVFGLGDQTKFCLVQDLGFMSPPPYNKWPIIDTWMCPRLHPNWDEIRRKFPGSGTPYKEIKQKPLIDWNNFKQHALNSMTKVI